MLLFFSWNLRIIHYMCLHVLVVRVNNKGYPNKTPLSSQHVSEDVPKSFLIYYSLFFVSRN